MRSENIPIFQMLMNIPFEFAANFPNNTNFIASQHYLTLLVGIRNTVQLSFIASPLLLCHVNNSNHQNTPIYQGLKDQ
jgi:hypothetical protein